MDNQHYTYKTLDHPIRILFWNLDDFLLLLAPILLAMSFGNLLFCLGVLLRIPYKRLQKNRTHSSFKHYMYWHMPTAYMSHFKRLPPSYLRELIL